MIFLVKHKLGYKIVLLLGIGTLPSSRWKTVRCGTYPVIVNGKSLVALFLFLFEVNFYYNIVISGIFNKHICCSIIIIF